MANPLTGDFDVVAQFSIPVVNRLLAAMHRIERFPHSLTIRVNDNPPPGSRFDMPTLVGVVDAFGDATSDQDRIPPTVVFPPPPRGLGALHAALDSVVNAGVGGVNVEPLTPSRLQGRAQVQVTPPTIEISDPSGTKVTVRLGLMCRYFPDPSTSPAAEFVRGDLVITAPVNTAASQLANVVAIDIKANTAQISFTPHWSSRPLTAEDRAGIDLVLRNALKTSFLPANITLPASIAHAQFKALSGASSAVAIMIDAATLPPSGTPLTPDPLNPDVVISEGGMLDVASSDTETPAGDPATLTQVFLAGTDDVAFAVSSDFVRQSFAPTLKKIRETPVERVSFPVNGLIYTWDVTYNIVLNDVSFDLENGKMVLTMRGHASTGSWTPNFDFTARQEFGLTANGPTAELAVGDLSFETSSWMVNAWMWLVDLFTGRAKKSFEDMRDSSLEESNARLAVRRMLNADDNLGGFLTSLLSPTRSQTPVYRQPYVLAYTSVEIRASGIVLHGKLSVLQPLPPRVEFEPIPASAQAGSGSHGFGGFITAGPEYSALKSWIPGGSIQEFEWKSEGQSGPGYTDENRFVRLSQAIVDPVVADAANLVSGYSPLCLTIRGTRLSSSGLVQSEAVEATVCGYNRFPIVGGIFAPDEVRPTIALTRPRPNGAVEVTGHTFAESDATGGGAPNLIVHFPDETTADRLDVFPEALRESGRRDAATALLVVMDAAQLDRARYTPGATYASNDDRVWERRFGVDSSRGAVTILVDTAGRVVWKQDGQVDQGMLADTLRKLLVAGKSVTSGILPQNVRIGHPPPNFLIEHAPGQEITLRKLRGRPTAIIFWRSSSVASIEAIRDLNRARRELKTLVLAVNDGEADDVARKAAAAARLSATVVPDPNRRVSSAYGVTIWPTIIELDSLGVVRAIRYGREEPAGAQIQSASEHAFRRSSQ